MMDAMKTIDTASVEHPRRKGNPDMTKQLLARRVRVTDDTVKKPLQTSWYGTDFALAFISTSPSRRQYIRGGDHFIAV